MIIVVILATGTFILKNNLEDVVKWNYDDFSSVTEILYNGKTIQNDKIIYWELKDIIYDYLSTMQDAEFGSEDDGVKVQTSEYYDVLSKEYTKILSEEEFENKSKEFITRFLYSDHLGYNYVSSFVISKIYLFDNTKYLCAISLKDSTEVLGYIGIEMDEKNAKFSIFYIE